jgi:glucose/arabinose dehydrogenase
MSRISILIKRKQSLVLVAGAILFLLALVIWLMVSPVKARQDDSYDWRADWAVTEGFAVSIDTDGYDFPTAIAFVPEPGSGPKDPLYFVAELRGRVKVVTNDRSVYTFAENFVQRKPEKELPDVEGETGLAGICLAPEQGYVFVTFAYQDSQGVLRNNVMRFDSKPRTFSLKPTGQLDFTKIFANFEAAVSHQIGSCQVANNALYVSVGDGRQTEESQNTNALLGKVLRISLDGKSLPDNPFYDATNPDKPANFVWSYGWRNPFGLKAVGDRIFVADNGSDIDRFAEALAGENYMWDGSDWSIGSHADIALEPDIGPAQLEFNPAGSKALPKEYDQSFFVAASRPDDAGIVRLQYDLNKKRATGVPDYFLRYQGAGQQIVVGIAVGPDGLYFVPTFPNADGRSFILKLAYDPAHQHPYLLSNITDPWLLMSQKSCFGCHQLDGKGGTAGPVLDQGAMVKQLNEKLNSPDYVQTVQQVDLLAREPFTSYKEARSEVLQAQGQERIRTWMIYHIMEPRFDNPNSLMPNLGLSRTEATAITDYLLQPKSFMGRVKDLVLPYLPVVILPRHLLFAFAIGLVAGIVGYVILVAILKRVLRRKRVREMEVNQ